MSGLLSTKVLHHRHLNRHRSLLCHTNTTITSSGVKRILQNHHQRYVGMKKTNIRTISSTKYKSLSQVQPFQNRTEYYTSIETPTTPNIYHHRHRDDNFRKYSSSSQHYNFSRPPPVIPPHFSIVSLNSGISTLPSVHKYQSNHDHKQQRHKSTTTTASSATKMSSTDFDKTTFDTNDNDGIKDMMPVMDQRKMFQYFQLNSFTRAEIEDTFDKILASSSTASTTKTTISSSNKWHNDQKDHGKMTTQHLTTFLLQRIKEIDGHFLKRNDIDLMELPEKHVKNRNNIMKQYAIEGANQFASLLKPTTTANIIEQDFTIDKGAFCEQIQTLATEIDTSRTLPISISMLLVGSSVGMIIPIMPYVVSNLGLTAGQYGIVVSSFAIAKLFANVPAAIFAEKHGRKPYLVYSLVIISMGVGGVGLASQFEHLVLCRLMTGIGVSALSTAATLTIADCSTPLNRATTMAPMMSAFAAGTALGPAMGGLLADRIGVSSTFYLVGCSYLALTLINRTFLKETKMIEEEKRVLPWQGEDRKIWKEMCVQEQLKRQQIDNESEGGLMRKTHFTGRNKDRANDDTMMDSITDAFSQWSPLLADPKVRNVVIINGFYWVSLAGSQMTLLPLILTDPEGLALTATSVGKVYMGMSLVQVLGNPTMAKFIDKVGKVPGIVIGCSLLSASMFNLTFCEDMNHLIPTLGFWALGSTMLSTAPVSYVSDTVLESQRAQAIALLRTAGDVGFLIGASGAGAVADLYNMDTALQSSAGLLLSATGWFAVRRLLSTKNKQ